MKNSEDDASKLDLFTSILAAERVLHKVNEAVVDRDLLDEAVEDLTERVISIKNLQLVQFRKLLLYLDYTVIATRREIKKNISGHGLISLDCFSFSYQC